MIGKIRPQILVAIMCATIFSMFTAWLGFMMQATEILTALVGGIFGFLGGVSLRIIESEGPEEPPGE
jgi:predicted CDP-diglyceride synthetase/phosphatidate cytidylyltransferase|tara:strand:+ start:1578 stop:1778 length:201 start_codon:yes stop_codon:yes gene_type:complete